MVDGPLYDPTLPFAPGRQVDAEPAEPFTWGPQQDALEDLAERLDEVISIRFDHRIESISCDWPGNRIVLGWEGPVPADVVAVIEHERADDQHVEFAKPDRRRELITRWRMIQDLSSQLAAAHFVVIEAWKSDNPAFVEVELGAESLERRVVAARIAGSVDCDPGRRVRLHWAAEDPSNTGLPLAPQDAQLLDIRFDTSDPNYPKVRLLVDGVEVLAHDGTDEPNAPADLLWSGALVPTEPPTRVAFYGCGCGEFGCRNVAGLVAREGHLIVWSDFRSLTGAYTSALPSEEEAPDPWTSGHGGFYDHSELAVQPVRFDAEQYLATVATATADRSWVNRTQAVVAEIRALRPDLGGVFADTGERIQIDYRRPGEELSDWAELDIPRGAPDVVAASLIELLESGRRLAEIKRKQLWR